MRGASEAARVHWIAGRRNGMAARRTRAATSGADDRLAQRQIKAVGQPDRVSSGLERLIETSTGSHLWADCFDAEVEDVFEAKIS